MAECKFCGKGAGFMRSEHPDCRKRYKEGKQRILELTRKTLFYSGDFDQLTKNVNYAANYGYISTAEVQKLLILGWERTADSLIRESKLSEAAEERLLAFPEHFSFSAAKNKHNSTLKRIHQARKKREQTKLREKLQAGKERVISLIRRQGAAPIIDNSLIRDINEVADRYELDRKMLGDALVEGWKEAVNDALQNTIMVEYNEHDRLVQLAVELSIPHSIIIESDELTVLRKIQLINNIDRGLPPPELYFAPGELPFNLIKSETLIWLFENAALLEWVEVYPSVLDGWGKLYDAKYDWLEVGEGVVGVTDYHIYFAVGGARIRLAYDDIVAFDMMTEGILISLAKSQSGPLLFLTPDIQFTYELLTRMAHL